MRRVKQIEIARFIEVSPGYMSEIRSGKKTFSKQKARDLSRKTGIPFAELALDNGEKLYQALSQAYIQECGENV